MSQRVEVRSIDNGMSTAQLERKMRQLKQDIQYNKRMSDELYERRQAIIDGSAILSKKPDGIPDGYAMCWGKLVKI